MADPTGSTSQYAQFETVLLEQLKLRVPEVQDYYFILDPTFGAGLLRLRMASYKRFDQTKVYKKLRIRVGAAFPEVGPVQLDSDTNITVAEVEEGDAQSRRRIEDVGDRIAKAIMIAGTQPTSGLDAEIQEVSMVYEDQRDSENSANDLKSWYNTVLIEFDIFLIEDLCPC